MILINNFNDETNRINSSKFIEDDFELEQIQTIMIDEATDFNNGNTAKKNGIFTLSILNLTIIILFILFVYGFYNILVYNINIRSNQKTSDLVLNIYDNTIINTDNIVESEDSTDIIDDEFIVSTANAINENSILINKLQQEFSNDEIFAYIEIDGTNINYPVVHTTDNDFYIENDISKKSNMLGSIFMDYENKINLDNLNTVIYGHNMRDGSMFHNLRYYSDKDFYDAHKYIYLKTEDKDTTWEVFSFYSTKTSFNYITTNFDTTSEFYDLLNEMKKRSIYDTGVEINELDTVLTLSTCTNSADDMRYVVNAKLIQAVLK